jgi:Enoyl-CoA hydratase/carnithine racemase
MSDTTYELTDDVAVVQIDRGERMNALSEALVAELTGAMDRAVEDEVRAVLLTHTGEAFSSGYDLRESGGRSADATIPSVEQGLDRGRRVLELFTAIHELPVPVIAAVRGYALAGGSDLALTCDLTYAGESAVFGYPGVRMGGMSLSLIYPFVMGIKPARELLYTGKTIDAAEAARIGMVNRCVPDDALMATVWEEIEAMKLTPRATLQITKHMLNDVMEMQGYRPAVRTSGYLATLSHQSTHGRRFFEIREEEGIGAAIEWMHAAEKP